MKYITREEFIKYVYPLATEVKEKYNITRIISITQSAHESSFGNSTLAIQAKNLFGIKATESWTKKGGKVWFGTTWENIKGKDITLVDGFRMYDTWRESFLDWAELISKAKIYQKAYEYAQLGDVSLYGKEITGKYATDPKYAEKLIKVSEEIKELCKKLEYEI